MIERSEIAEWRRRRRWLFWKCVTLNGTLKYLFKVFTSACCFIPWQRRKKWQASYVNRYQESEREELTLPDMMAGRSTRHEEERRLRVIALRWSMCCIEPVGLNGTGRELTGRRTKSTKEIVVLHRCPRQGPVRSFLPDRLSVGFLLMANEVLFID